MSKIQEAIQKHQVWTIKGMQEVVTNAQRDLLDAIIDDMKQDWNVRHQELNNATDEATKMEKVGQKMSLSTWIDKLEQARSSLTSNPKQDEGCTLMSFSVAQMAVQHKPLSTSPAAL
ncbi:hypothetical protein COW46_00750 [Candidatus Gracilibacteria bacterium CG17_big_fil_post_rev_8_21_14_2_50_48_13]|nr:MAG: hypothetical protein COW46_00750 [Candidatus Gracilibacteria bacterium CG17_big_fil_post_rev_8_21_14_2_50_48_13]